MLGKIKSENVNGADENFYRRAAHNFVVVKIVQKHTITKQRVKAKE